MDKTNTFGSPISAMSTDTSKSSKREKTASTICSSKFSGKSVRSLSNTTLRAKVSKKGSSELRSKGGEDKSKAASASSKVTHKASDSSTSTKSTRTSSTKSSGSSFKSHGASTKSNGASTKSDGASAKSGGSPAKKSGGSPTKSSNRKRKDEESPSGSMSDTSSAMGKFKKSKSYASKNVGDDDPDTMDISIDLGKFTRKGQRMNVLFTRPAYSPKYGAKVSLFTIQFMEKRRDTLVFGLKGKPNAVVFELCMPKWAERRAHKALYHTFLENKSDYYTVGDKNGKVVAQVNNRSGQAYETQHCLFHIVEKEGVAIDEDYVNEVALELWRFVTGVTDASAVSCYMSAYENCGWKVDDMAKYLKKNVPTVWGKNKDLDLHIEPEATFHRCGTTNEDKKRLAEVIFGGADTQEAIDFFNINTDDMKEE